MKKNILIYSEDYEEVLEEATAFVENSRGSAVVLDSINVLCGVRTFTKRYDFHDFFWRSLGWKNVEILHILHERLYIGNNVGEYKDENGNHISLSLNDEILEFLVGWHRDGLQKHNFLSLCVAALGCISGGLKQYFYEHGIDVENVLGKGKRIVSLIEKTSLDAVDFFMVLYRSIISVGENREKIDIENIFDAMKIYKTQSDLTDSDAINGSIEYGFGTKNQTYENNLQDIHDIVEEKSDNDKKQKKDIVEEKKLTIEYFAIDLTREAKSKSLDPVIGREKETDRLIYTLLRKTKNNPLLIGEAGVGKTAIVEGLAQRIIENKVPEKLRGKRIMMLDIGSLVAGTKYRGEFEARLKAITEEAMDPTNAIILFIDEIHNIIGAGSAEGTGDAANILKPLLARGRLQLIGATTFDEYQKYIEKDAALKRRFQELHVDEPSRDVAIEILQGIKERFEEYHGVNINSDAIEKAVDYSIRYMMNKYLPDKAIDIIDEACARLSTLQKKLQMSDEYVATEKKIKKIQKSLEKAIEKQDYFHAAKLKEQEEKEKERLRNMRQQNVLPKHLRSCVGVDHIGKVVSDKLGIPVHQITESEIHKLAYLDKHLKSLIFGQDEAVDAVVHSIRRSRLSALKKEKPIGSFLFLGPSGVGKTYLAKLLAREFFGSEKSLIRVDMSEFMERHSAAKMIGSAPGYVGYEEGGVLTEQVRRKPYSVILFDEIEKASPDVLNILLQILDEGHLKDNKGRRIDFKNTIIIMTSNIGSEYFGKSVTRIGFVNYENVKQYTKQHFSEIRERVLERVKKYIKPELLNRIQKQIVFQPLDKKTLVKIFKMQLNTFYEKWKERRGIVLPRFGDKRIQKVVNDIYDPQFGARPIERYLHETLEEKLIQQVIEKEMKK